VNLPKISEPRSASQLRDRALAALNGESKQLAAADQERRKRVLDAPRSAEKGEGR
jgi:hypothetical protein